MMFYPPSGSLSNPKNRGWKLAHELHVAFDLFLKGSISRADITDHFYLIDGELVMRRDAGWIDYCKRMGKSVEPVFPDLHKESDPQ